MSMTPDRTHDAFRFSISPQASADSIKDIADEENGVCEVDDRKDGKILSRALALLHDVLRSQLRCTHAFGSREVEQGRARVRLDLDFVVQLDSTSGCSRAYYNVRQIYVWKQCKQHLSTNL